MFLRICMFLTSFQEFYAAVLVHITVYSRLGIADNVRYAKYMETTILAVLLDTKHGGV